MPPVKPRVSPGGVEPLYLVDGTSFLYRGFYAYPDLKRADGMATGAIFIVLRILLRILREEKPKYLGFFMDGKGPTFRHERFAPYKAQRPAMPEGLAAQIEPLRDAVRMLGLSLTVSQGVEADDCIASLAAAHHETRPVVIVGSDKDLKQCLTSSVYLWDPAGKNEKLTGESEFIAETGIRPAQWPDLQALMGDSSDNIPGLPGVGPKTALKVMQDFPTLEDIRERMAELPESFRKKLEGRVEDVFLYRELTRLRTDCCPDLGLETLSVRPPEVGPLSDFLREYEFRSLLREIPAPAQTSDAAPVAAQGQASLLGDAPVSAKAPRKSTPKASAQPQLLLFGAATEPAPLSAPAAESSLPVTDVLAPGGLPDFSGRVVGLVPLELQPDGKAGFRIALEGETQEREWRYLGPVPGLIERLQSASAVAAPSVQELLRQDPAWDGVPLALWFDLGLAAYLLNPEDRGYGFDRLRLALYSAPDGMEEGATSETPDADAAEPSPHPQAQGLAALACRRRFLKRLAAAGLSDLMRDLELPLIPVLVGMERRGVRIDFASFKAFLDEVTAQVEGHSARIQELASAAGQTPFNVRSSQQLAALLFDKLGLKPAGKTPGGALSTGSEALEKLMDQHPIISEVLAFRSVEKLRSTYLEPLPRQADAQGRLHTRFNQLATATGRLSSSGPNLQNIPIRGPQGKRMRACFIADPGKLLVAADYSQVELRVLAHFSQDPALIDAFRHDEDIHSRTAALLFDKPAGEVTPDERRGAKTINFGLIYGMGPQKLARELSITTNQAKEFIARYFEKLGTLKAFYETLIEDALVHGYVTTLAGRRRLLPELHSRNQQVQAQARRQAVNTVIQGSAADVIKLAMLKVHDHPRLRELDARLILQVHDELLLEAPEAAAPEAAGILAGLMQDVVALRVPLKVDLGTGRTWADAH